MGWRWWAGQQTRPGDTGGRGGGFLEKQTQWYHCSNLGMLLHQSVTKHCPSAPTPHPGPSENPPDPATKGLMPFPEDASWKKIMTLADMGATPPYSLFAVSHRQDVDQGDRGPGVGGRRGEGPALGLGCQAGGRHSPGSGEALTPGSGLVWLQMEQERRGEEGRGAESLSD